MLHSIRPRVCLTPSHFVAASVRQGPARQTVGIRHPIRKMLRELHNTLSTRVVWDGRSCSDIDPLILFTRLSQGGYPWSTVETILSSVTHVRRGVSKRAPVQIDLKHLLETLAVEVDAAEFISKHTGFEVKGPWNRLIRPFEELMQADRHGAVDLYLGGVTDPKVLFFGLEHDGLCDEAGVPGLPVPRFVRWGIQTLRALSNFPPSDDYPEVTSPHFIRGLLLAKKSALIAARHDLIEKKVPAKKIDACLKSIDRLLKFNRLEMRRTFPVNAVQGGAGTSWNMMVNEVIANTAIDILGGRKGAHKDKETGVSVELPNTQQSTNDCIPTGLLIGLYMALEEVLLGENGLPSLQKAAQKRAADFAASQTAILGRTEGQPALPMMLSHCLSGMASCVAVSIEQIKTAQAATHELPMGATAIGSGHNATARYRDAIIPAIHEVTDLKVWKPSSHFHAALRDGHGFATIAHALEFAAGRVLAMANDLWDKTRSGEITHPRVQPGSSIMPGKVNPVWVEVARLWSLKVSAASRSVNEALRLYANCISDAEPLMGDQLFGAIDMLGNATTAMRRAVEGFEINDSVIREKIGRSPIGLFTAFAGAFPENGHALGDKAAAILRKRQGLWDQAIITQACLDAARELAFEAGVVEAVVKDYFDHPEKYADPHPDRP